jgi:hypothetical protein
MKGTVRERLLSRLYIEPGTGCLLWAGCLNSRGYGVISVAGKRELVHRVAWQIENGPIPDGLTIDHVHDRGCRHKHCGNVAHLEPVTSAENTRRGRTVLMATGWEPPKRGPVKRTWPTPEYLAQLAEWLGP